MKLDALRLRLGSHEIVLDVHGGRPRTIGSPASVNRLFGAVVLSHPRRSLALAATGAAGCHHYQELEGNTQEPSHITCTKAYKLPAIAPVSEYQEGSTGCLMRIGLIF
jgi:hypothetical protein